MAVPSHEAAREAGRQAVVCSLICRAHPRRTCWGSPAQQKQLLGLRVSTAGLHAAVPSLKPRAMHYNHLPLR